MEDLAPQIVGVGRASSEPTWRYERAHGKDMGFIGRCAVGRSGLGAGDPATPYQVVGLPAHVKMGLRYRVTFLVSTLGSDLRIRASSPTRSRRPPPTTFGSSSCRLD